MSALSDVFSSEAKVVISPDEMRAWIMLPPPAKGAPYTAAAVDEWLGRNRVVYGVSQNLVREAVESRKYHELLEVARGDVPVNGTRGSYTLHVEKKPFTGLKGAPDGSLYYDDLTFLQEAEQQQILAEVVLPDLGAPGTSVTGEPIAQKQPQDSKVLEGSGFEITDDGKYYRAPSLSHVNIVNDQLIVTPLLKLESVSEQDGPIEFTGNILVEKDVLPSSSITASGSIFVAGRAAASTLKAGRNVLLSQGMRSSGGFGSITAKENIWGLCFESSEITAGGDLFANHLEGCEGKVNGRATILGGRGSVSTSSLYAKNGIVASKLGGGTSGRTLLSAGIDNELIDRMEGMDKRISKLGVDIQGAQQNITAFERLNRMKPEKGRNDPTYRDMITKRDNALRILSLLNEERTRLKRTVDSFSAVSIIARDGVYPGVVITIDTREREIDVPLPRAKFRRDGEEIEIVTAQTK